MQNDIISNVTNDRGCSISSGAGRYGVAGARIITCSLIRLILLDLDLFYLF